MSKVLAFDTSLSCPGAAIIAVRRRKPKIVALSHVTTTSRDNHAVRAEQIYGWVVDLLRVNGTDFDAIVREDFQGRSSRQNHPVFAAWSAIDRALNAYGLSFTAPAISQSAVKKTVVGRGKAEKDEVASVVRKLTGYDGEFAVDDESDAAAVALAWMMRENMIEGART